MNVHLARGVTPEMATSSNTRTLRAYLTDLLATPRWIIEREVDFTDCPQHGHFNKYFPECVNCRFGKGCRWLDRQEYPNTENAPLDELIDALETSIDYLQSTSRQSETSDIETRAWMREARRILRTNRG